MSLLLRGYRRMLEITILGDSTGLEIAGAQMALDAVEIEIERDPGAFVSLVKGYCKDRGIDVEEVA